jgi:hypothetical protein
MPYGGYHDQYPQEQQYDYQNTQYAEDQQYGMQQQQQGELTKV